MSLNISEEHYRKLQKILEKENGKTYTTEEIREIGNNLVELYELLLDNSEED